jgi:hypothetical protein
MTEPLCITNNPPDFATLVREALDADEAPGSAGSLRGIKYAILAVAQAIRDSEQVVRSDDVSITRSAA